MHRRLDDLDRCVVAHIHRQVGGHPHLRQAEGSGVGLCRGTDDLEGWHHNVGHVWWDCAEAEVHVEEGFAMAGEPAGLQGHGAASCGPFCAVRGGGHAAAWEG